MERMKRVEYRQQSARRGVDINMSPLIDVVFLLLIFFVVTTVFVEETGVDIQQPKAASATELERNSILIALTDDGQIMYGGRQVSLNGIRGIVSQQLREKQVPVILIGDEKAQIRKLVSLIDECKLAGAKQVSIAAKHE